MNHSDTRPLALFDLDGTLLSCDSLWSFLTFTLSPLTLASGLFRLALPLCPLRPGFSRDRAKEQLLAHFYTGWSRERLEAAGEQLAERLIPDRLFPGAEQAIQEYVQKGFRVIVVSASPEIWSTPCAVRLGAECIGTLLEFENGVFTGRFSSQNCTGEEKVRRVKACVSEIENREIHAYGNSSDDLPMLRMASQGFYRHFSKKNNQEVPR